MPVEDLELRPGVFLQDASEALNRLRSASSRLQELVPSKEAPPDLQRQGARNWAAAAAGTLDLIYTEIDRRIDDLLRNLVQSNATVDDPDFRSVLEWVDSASSFLWPSRHSFTYDEYSCPLCGQKLYLHTATDQQDEAEQNIGIFKLDHCARFATVGAAWFHLLTARQRTELAWFVHTREKRGRDAPLLCPGSLSPGKGVFTFADIRSIVPKNVGAIHDELLLTIASAARREEETFSRYIRFGQENAPLALSSSFGDLVFHVDELKKKGLLEESGNDVPFRNDVPYQTEVRLALDGWLRVEQLEQGAVEKPFQGFVAMWFDDEMQRVYREGIEPAIRAAGYDSMQMSLLEHNDDINDRIIAEIRKSRFVVADFTGNRGGVYFEAGFALGLGKPVIWTCQREFFETHGVHFDTQARNHILWDTPEDLHRSLRARIEATVPRTG